LEHLKISKRAGGRLNDLADLGVYQKVRKAVSLASLEYRR
jgi:hypothetical protein